MSPSAKLVTWLVAARIKRWNHEGHEEREGGRRGKRKKEKENVTECGCLFPIQAELFSLDEAQHFLTNKSGSVSIHTESHLDPLAPPFGCEIKIIGSRARICTLARQAAYEPVVAEPT
jgi:hypothetical protein